MPNRSVGAQSNFAASGWSGAPSSSQPKNQSFAARAWGDVENAFKSFPAGVVHAVANAPRELWNVGKVYKTALFEPSKFQSRYGKYKGNLGAIEKDFPSATASYQSVKQTGTHAAGLGYISGVVRNPATQRAWAQTKSDFSQRPFTAGLNDVANLALGAEGAGTAFKAFGVPAVGEALVRAGKLGGGVAGTPAYPYRAAVRGLGEVGNVAERAIGRFGSPEAVARAAEIAHPVRTWLAPVRERSAFRQTLATAQNKGLAEVGGLGAPTRAVQQAGEALKPVGPHAWDALTLARTQAPANLEALAHMAPAERQSVLSGFFAKPVSEDAFATAYHFQRGTLPAEHQVAMTRAQNLLRTHVTGPREAQSVAGVGFGDNPALSVEQTRAGPMWGHIAQPQPGGGFAIPAGAEENIYNASALSRPSVALGQHIYETTGQRGIRSPAELAASGFTPTHIKGAEEQVVGRPTPTGGLGPSLPRSRNPLAAKETFSVPRTPGEQLRWELADRNTRASNIAAEQIAANKSWTLTPRDLMEIPKIPGPGGRAVELAGRPLADYMARQVDSRTGQAGYKAWNPSSIFEEVKPENVTADTPFLPANILDSFRKGQQGPPGWVSGMNKVLRPFYAGNLALNPHWHLHRALGNAFMYTVGGGEGPVSLVRNLAKARQAMKTQGGSIEDVLPPELQHRTTPAVVGEEALGAPGNRNVLRHPIQSSYKVHTFLDDLFHNATYMAKRDKGYSHEAAVGEANKIMGDFKTLSPTEQNYVKVALPFYPWYRQVAQTAGRLARDNPMRLAWTLHAETLRSQQEKDLPDNLQGRIPMGGGYLNVGSLNPLYNVPTSPVLSVKGAAGALNPIAKTGYALAMGHELGWGDVSRPHGEHGALKPGEWLPYLAGQSAATRAVSGAIRKPVRRYATGQPKVGAKGGPEPGGRLGVVRRAFGSPWPEKPASASTSRSATGGGGWA